MEFQYMFLENEIYVLDNCKYNATNTFTTSYITLANKRFLYYHSQQRLLELKFFLLLKISKQSCQKNQGEIEAKEKRRLLLCKNVCNK